MKKWLIGIAIVLVVAMGCVYMFIPDELVVSCTSPVRCTPQAVFRQVCHGGDWVKWWSGSATVRDGKRSYLYAGDVYNVSANSYPFMEIDIHHEEKNIKSRMSVLSVSNKDSAVIYWQCRLSGGGGLLQRMRQYLFAGKLEKNMSGILSRLRPFLENEKNIYGMTFGEGSTKDTLLVVTKAYFPVYPGTGEIYGLLGKLRAYISEEGAKESGYPIANVTFQRDSGYQLMTAIPVNRVLQGKGAIFFRRMVPAKFLIAETKGGDQTIRTAFHHMQEYIADHQRTVMAIPFQTIVTDRMKEADTTKWSTWLYCPVF